MFTCLYHTTSTFISMHMFSPVLQSIAVSRQRARFSQSPLPCTPHHISVPARAPLPLPVKAAVLDTSSPQNNIHPARPHYFCLLCPHHTSWCLFYTSLCSNEWPNTWLSMGRTNFLILIEVTSISFIHYMTLYEEKLMNETAKCIYNTFINLILLR